MDKEKLDKILEDHALWLKDQSKGNLADLSYANLSYADLSYTNLRYADLRYTDLSDANLNGADLWGADLRGADLCRADLCRANLCRADLSYADLGYTNLRYANLSYTDLSYANLSYANLRCAKDGNDDLLKCNTVNGLKWNIVMFQDIVTVGCKKYTLEEWKNFEPVEIEVMDKEHALDFYPVLMDILKNEYKGTKWEF